MSRIHEALKRAEQERASSPAEAAPSLPETHPPAGVDPAAPSAVHPATPRQAWPTAPPAGPLTYELLSQHCARPHWSPDHKTMLFFGGDSHVRGSEEFRTLRSRLYQFRAKAPLRRVLITSALPAEGKTFTAANLAQVIARQHERRALLIDGDLRLSRLHFPLGAPSAPGLTEYLRGEVDELAIVQRGPQENLFLIPGGKQVSNAAELIGSPRMKDLLDKLTPLFDWVILDSPPAIPVSDASRLADLCDGVLMVVQSASTPYDLAQKVRQEFFSKNLLGVVLNNVEASSSYSSYYYSNYGYSRPSNGKGKA